jgi:AcrR family transcriptional regulator
MTSERTTQRLTKETVMEQALALADGDGLDALTVRRLATDLGVTPMALYWHFRNKDELLIALADHLMAELTTDREESDPWQVQLRVMVEALVRVMRAHPCAPTLLFSIDKSKVASFVRGTETALALLTSAGFTHEQAWQVSSYLLHGSIALASDMTVHCPPSNDAVEFRRQHMLAMQALPADEYPHTVAYAASSGQDTDQDAYRRFGIDLLMSGVTSAAANLVRG